MADGDFGEALSRFLLSARSGQKMKKISRKSSVGKSDRGKERETERKVVFQRNGRVDSGPRIKRKENKEGGQENLPSKSRPRKGRVRPKETEDDTI